MIDKNYQNWRGYEKTAVEPAMRCPVWYTPPFFVSLMANRAFNTVLLESTFEDLEAQTMHPTHTLSKASF